MTRNILIRIPAYSFGNIGDLAIIKTIKNLYCKDNLIIPDNIKDLNSLNLSKIDFLIYIGNDCIAFYDISTVLINNMLSLKKKSTCY